MIVKETDAVIKFHVDCLDRSVLIRLQRKKYLQQILTLKRLGEKTRNYTINELGKLLRVGSLLEEGECGVFSGNDYVQFIPLGEVRHVNRQTKSRIKIRKKSKRG